jgi:hypothetical protein
MRTFVIPARAAIISCGFSWQELFVWVDSAASASSSSSRISSIKAVGAPWRRLGALLTLLAYQLISDEIFVVDSSVTYALLLALLMADVHCTAAANVSKKKICCREEK